MLRSSNFTIDSFEFIDLDQQITAMAVNLTGFDEHLYFSLNTAAGVGLFLIFVLPALILCVLCVLALFFARGINWPIKTLLINIFASEICVWVGISVLFLGFPGRMRTDEAISCSVSFSAVITGSLLRFSGIALYAIMVYIFLKYGSEKLKWFVIIPYLVASWLVSFAISLVPFIGDSRFEDNGFCDVNQDSIWFKVSVSLVYGGVVILFVIIIIFSLLTFFFAKKNSLQDNTEIKKAVAKNLLYLNIVAILSFFYNLVPVSFPFIRAAFKDHLVVSVVLNYCLRVFYFLPSLIIPIAAIAILKPVRLTLKQGMVKCFRCQKDQETDREATNETMDTIDE